MNPDVVIVFKGSPMGLAGLVGAVCYVLGMLFGVWLTKPNKKEEDK